MNKLSCVSDRLDFRRSLLAGSSSVRTCSGEERGLISRTAAGNAFHKKIRSLRLHVSTAVLVQKCNIKELKKRK